MLDYHALYIVFVGYEKFEIFNFMFSGIMSTDLLITRQLISDSWLVTDITSHVREPRGMASGAKCHTEQSATPQGHLLVSVGATSRYPHRVLFALVTHNAYSMEISATKSKMSHHTRGGDHLLVSVGATLDIHYRVRGFPSLMIQHLTRNNNNIKNVGFWSLLRSDTGTHISDPNEFYWSTHPSTHY